MPHNLQISACGYHRWKAKVHINNVGLLFAKSQAALITANFRDSIYELCNGISAFIVGIVLVIFFAEKLVKATVSTSYGLAFQRFL